jgi:hypothetical protein
LWGQSSPPAIVVQADRTGKLDARPAIQKSIDAAAALGGGTVSFPKGTYLLNSYRPSTHPWKFYNLLVPSNVTLEGEPGTILLQGPDGRAPLPSRAEHVENNVVSVGTPSYQAVTFQDPARNGGFRPAQPTQANASSVTLSNPGDAAKFRPGDFIVIYAATTGDVIESEPTSVTAVDAGGVLRLAHPLARSFPHAFVARVTHLATTRVTLRNLTIQGAVPLAATEVFDLSLENCRLIYDSAVSRSTLVTPLQVNTVRGFHMRGGSIEPSNGRFVGLEMPQRNSQDVEFENVTFQVACAVFGEYAAHWKLVGNQFWIHPDSTTTAGIATGGLDVEVAQNTIHGENLTAGGGSGALLTDGIGPPDYVNFIGREVFRGNTIECRADGNNCLRLTTRDPVVDQNRIIAGGSATGIKIEGAAAEFVITGNQMTMGPLPALVLNVADLHAAVVKGNVLSGTGPHAIVIGGSSPGPAAARFSAGNSFSGFGSAILDLTAAPRGRPSPGHPER